MEKQYQPVCVFVCDDKRDYLENKHFFISSSSVFFTSINVPNSSSCSRSRSSTTQQNADQIFDLRSNQLYKAYELNKRKITHIKIVDMHVQRLHFIWKTYKISSRDLFYIFFKLRIYQREYGVSSR